MVVYIPHTTARGNSDGGRSSIQRMHRRNIQQNPSSSVYIHTINRKHKRVSLSHISVCAWATAHSVCCLVVLHYAPKYMCVWYHDVCMLVYCRSRLLVCNEGLENVCIYMVSSSSSVVHIDHQCSSKVVHSNRVCVWCHRSLHNLCVVLMVGILQT